MRATRGHLSVCGQLWEKESWRGLGPQCWHISVTDRQNGRVMWSNCSLHSWKGPGPERPGDLKATSGESELELGLTQGPGLHSLLLLWSVGLSNSSLKFPKAFLLAFH